MSGHRVRHETIVGPYSFLGWRGWPAETGLEDGLQAGGVEGSKGAT